MVIKGEDAESKAILNAAEKMCAAARTAPKAKGIDKIVTLVLTGEDKDTLAKEMFEIGKTPGAESFLRDGKNVLDSSAVILIGTKKGVRNIFICGGCGYENCADMIKNNGHCAFDDIDLGIAVGSAAAIAADNRIDSRIMHSVGIATIRAKLLGDEVYKAFGIPISVSGKSIYFDRK